MCKHSTLVRSISWNGRRLGMVKNFPPQEKAITLLVKKLTREVQHLFWLCGRKIFRITKNWLEKLDYIGRNSAGKVILANPELALSKKKVYFNFFFHRTYPHFLQAQCYFCYIYNKLFCRLILKQSLEYRKPRHGGCSKFAMI